MINKEIILECIKEPMEHYHQEALHTIGDWEPLLDASEKLLAGIDVADHVVPSVFRPIVKMMRLIMQVTKDSEWDWSSPAHQEVYKEIAESQIYKMFADTTVNIVSSIIRTVKIGSLVEIGTGPGKVTSSLCEQMVKDAVDVPIIISDKSPGVSLVGDSLRKSFPQLTISDFLWDFKEQPPGKLIEKLTKPVLLFERFCIPYGGYDAIDNIGPIADILIMVEDLNLTGKKEAYDLIYEKIGSQFFIYKEARKYLDKHFSFIHTCDRKVIESIKSPVTDFTLAIK